MSIVLLIPILAIAGYMIYRYLKGELTSKDGACCGCSEQSTCRKRSCE